MVAGARQGARRSTRGNSDKRFHPKHAVRCRASVHAEVRSVERRERQAARREVREALADCGR